MSLTVWTPTPRSINCTPTARAILCMMWFFISLVVTPARRVPVVHVDQSQQQAMVSTLQFRPLEFYHSQVGRTAHVSDEQRKNLLWRLHQHVKSTGAANQAQSMCSTALKSFPDDITFRDFLHHGSSLKDDLGRAGHDEFDQQGEQEQAAASSSRCDKGSRNGSTGSSCQRILALSKQPCGGQLAEEQPRPVAALSSLQPEVGLCPQTGCSKFIHPVDELQHGQPHADRARTNDERAHQLREYAKP